MSGSRPTGERGRGAIPEPVLAEIEQRLRQREVRRDEIYDRARRLRRLAQTAMGHLHEGTAAPGELAEIRRSTAEFAAELRDDLREDTSLAQDALQECVEALLLDAVLLGGPLPGPTELGVAPEPYLMGLGDLVGEVRRLALRALADDRLTRAEELLELMEVLYHALMRFDAPRGIVALKPKQDTARALVERTRGDVTLARVLARAHLPAVPSGGHDP